MSKYNLIIFLFFFISCSNNSIKKEEEIKIIKKEEIKTPSEKSMIEGEKIYTNVCKICHQQNGQGVKGIYPPFAQADYLMEDVNRGIRQALFGSNGNLEMTVNGIKYNGIMLAYGETMNDSSMSFVLTYITNSWGNNHGIIKPEEILKIRKEGRKEKDNF